jgi:hypothetical protein
MSNDLGLNIFEPIIENYPMTVPKQQPLGFKLLDGSTVEHSPAPGAWPVRLSFDVALGLEDDTTLCERYNLSTEEYNFLIVQPAFRAEVAAHLVTIKENGISFSTKSKLIAEETLTEIYSIINNPAIGPSVRLDAWRAVVKAAGLEQAPEKTSGINANTVNIQINY